MKPDIEQEFDDDMSDELALAGYFDTDSTEIKVKVYRVPDRGDARRVIWLFDTTPAATTHSELLETLRDDHGGGNFKIRLYDVTGKGIGTQAISVGSPLPKPILSESQEKKDDFFSNPLFIMMREQANQQQQLFNTLLAGMLARPTPAPVEGLSIGDALQLAAALKGDGNNSADTLELMKQGIELGKLISGNAPEPQEEGFMGMLQSLAPAIAAAASGAMARPQQPQPRPQPQPQPQPQRLPRPNPLPQNQPQNKANHMTVRPNNQNQKMSNASSPTLARPVDNHQPVQTQAAIEFPELVKLPWGDEITGAEIKRAKTYLEPHLILNLRDTDVSELDAEVFVNDTLEILAIALGEKGEEILFNALDMFGADMAATYVANMFACPDKAEFISDCVELLLSAETVDENGTDSEFALDHLENAELGDDVLSDPITETGNIVNTENDDKMSDTSLSDESDNAPSISGNE